MASTRIAELASILSTNISEIDEYLSARELPTPSFNPDTPPSLLDGVQPLQQAALRAIDELQALLGGNELPGQTSCNSIASTLAINRFKIAENFPKDKDEATYDEIAHACGLNQSTTRRIIRNAMTRFIFRESRPGFVAHTATSKRIATDSALQDSLSVIDKEDRPSASRLIDALEKWPDAQEPTETGYQLANGTNEPVFSYLAHHHPDRAQTFARLMNAANTDPTCSPEYLLDGFPWAEIGQQEATVVDVGGGYGHISVALARRYPSLRCFVQDRPEIVAQGPVKVPAALKDRLTFQEHDFFAEQPRKGADVYLLRWILHDWSDKYAVKILRALVPALTPGARVIVNEAVMPEPGVLSPFDERKIRDFDFTMWHYQNGKEREAEEWKTLFQEADTRFDLVSITHPTGSALAIIEVVWRGD